jgi:hypothetical protein
MKKFSEIKTRINEADEVIPNLASNYDEMSKEDLVKMLQGQKNDDSHKEETSDSEDKPEILGENSNPSKFFSKLFESREMAHIYHLQVNGEMGSHAKHTALGDYYESVLEFVDEMIEVWQGQYGIIEEYDVIDTSTTKEKDTIEYFNELVRFIKEERKCIPTEDTHLHNIIDEVVALVYKTLYKLKYNK